MKLNYFLFLKGNAGYVCVSVETRTLFVWVQTDLDVTQHIPVPLNSDFTLLCILRHIFPRKILICVLKNKTVIKILNGKHIKWQAAFQITLPICFTMLSLHFSTIFQNKSDPALGTPPALLRKLSKTLFL